MNEIIEIKRNDFVKYLKCIYLVKGFQKLDNGKYRLNYHFRSIRKDNAKLYTNEFDDIYGYLSEKIKKTTIEETKFIISKIKTEYPNFDTSFIKTELNLNVEDSIEFLKSKGYIVYKQV